LSFELSEDPHRGMEPDGRDSKYSKRVLDRRLRLEENGYLSKTECFAFEILAA